MKRHLISAALLLASLLPDAVADTAAMCKIYPTP